MLIDTILTKVSYAIFSLTSIFQSIEIPEKDIKISYTLYTPEKPQGTPIKNIENIEISRDYELKILTHGYYTYKQFSTQWYQRVVDEYMKRGTTNVITANYTDAIKDVKLYEMPKYAEFVGVRLGNFVMELNKLKLIHYQKVHIIGNFLGAHIAGVAGETIDKETGKLVDRITGIDPVTMGHMELQSDGRLSRNDAAFVDVIHGTGWSYKREGRIDFYASAFPVKCRYDWAKAAQVGTELFTDTINNEEVLEGVKCLNKKYYYGNSDCQRNVTAQLGENVDRAMFGKFYLRTEDIGRYVCKESTPLTTTEQPISTIVQDDSE